MVVMQKMAVLSGVLDKRDLRSRLRSAQGHMRAIAEMIESDSDCIDILRQVSAVRGAIRAINRELWQAFLLDKESGLRSEDETERVKAWQELEALLLDYQQP